MPIVGPPGGSCLEAGCTARGASSALCPIAMQTARVDRASPREVGCDLQGDGGAPHARRVLC
jgi:hypothetical protein